MKKLIITLALTIVAIVNVNAQEVINKLNLTGFTVKIERARKFSYQSNSPITSEVNGDQLTLKANGTERAELTIFTPDVKAIKLSNCDMTINYNINIKELELNMTNSSTATLNNVNMNSLATNMSSNSKLTMYGKVQELDCNLSQSIIETPFLAIGNLRLSAVAQSIANMRVDAKRIDANVELASGVTFRGYSDVLKCYNGADSKIQAGQLEVNRAQVSSTVDGMVTINSKQVLTDSVIKNLYAENK